LRSYFVLPCAAIERESRNDSPATSPAGVVDVSPSRLTFVMTGEPVGEPPDAYAALRWKSAMVESMSPAM
jgi:hypothetical protein